MVPVSTDEDATLYKDPDDPVLVFPAGPPEAERVAHTRAYPIGGDHEVRRYAAPVRELQHAFGPCARIASINATPVSTGRNARRSVTWTWQPPQAVRACF